MMNNDFYIQIAETYNREQGTGIMVKEDINSVLTPGIDLDTQEVTFNPHFQTLLALFNLSTCHKQEGCMAIHHFLLYHLAMRKNMYGKAEELLVLLKEDMERLYGVADKDERQFFSFLSEFQTVFILIHEFSHIFYHTHPDKLDQNSVIQKENLIWLRKQLDTDPPLLVRVLHFVVPQMKHAQEHSFDEAIGSLELQEELLCDDAAWHMTYHLLELGIPNSEQRALLSAYVVFTLYYIEAQRTLGNIYFTDDYNQCQKDLMFGTTRSTVLVNTIWDDVPHETIRQYQSLVNDISRQGRIALMLPLRKNLEHIAYIRLMEKGKYSMKETMRLHTIYEKIETRFKV